MGNKKKNNNKKVFIEPTLQMIKVEKDAIITTSGPIPTGMNVGGGLNNFSGGNGHTF